MHVVKHIMRPTVANVILRVCMYMHSLSKKYSVVVSSK